MSNSPSDYILKRTDPPGLFVDIDNPVGTYPTITAALAVVTVSDTTLHLKGGQTHLWNGTNADPGSLGLAIHFISEGRQATIELANGASIDTAGHYTFEGVVLTQAGPIAWNVGSADFYNCTVDSIGFIISSDPVFYFSDSTVSVYFDLAAGLYNGGGTITSDRCIVTAIGPSSASFLNDPEETDWTLTFNNCSFTAPHDVVFFTTNTSAELGQHVYFNNCTYTGDVSSNPYRICSSAIVSSWFNTPIRLQNVGSSIPVLGSQLVDQSGSVLILEANDPGTWPVLDIDLNPQPAGLRGVLANGEMIQFDTTLIAPQWRTSGGGIQLTGATSNAGLTATLVSSYDGTTYLASGSDNTFRVSGTITASGVTNVGATFPVNMVVTNSLGVLTIQSGSDLTSDWGSPANGYGVSVSTTMEGLQFDVGQGVTDGDTIWTAKLSVGEFGAPSVAPSMSPLVLAQNTSAQTGLSNGFLTPITNWTASLNMGAAFDVMTGNFTVPETGYYFSYSH